jgi:hypothetical protein
MSPTTTLACLTTLMGGLSTAVSGVAPPFNDWRVLLRPGLDLGVASGLTAELKPLREVFGISAGDDL